MTARGSDFEVGTATALFPAPLWGGTTWLRGRRAQYDVAPDGRFVMLRESSTPTRIEVVLDWFEELKVRVPAD